jgi:hypothetical protein
VALPVTEWFIIKSLTVPSSWVAVLLALILTGIVVWRVFGKETEDWYSDAAILFLLVWKLSVVVTDFDMILDSPLSILYFNGGETGLYLGVIAALGRLFWQLRRKGWPESELVAMLIAMVMVQSLYQLFMVLLNEAEMWQKILTVLVFVGLTMLTWQKAKLSSVWRIQLTILFLAGHLFVSILQPRGFVQTPLFVTGLFVLCSVAIYVVTHKQQEQMGEKL